MDIECFTTARWLFSGGLGVITIIASFQGLPYLGGGVVGEEAFAWSDLVHT